MPSAGNEGLSEAGCGCEHDTLPDPDVSKSPIKPQDEGEEEEEDEEEDVDFNPFLKGTPSPEASSSLSSEVVGDSDHGEEEITMHATISPKAAGEKNECQKDVPRKTKKRKSVFITQSEVNIIREKENGSTSSGIDVNEGMVGDVSNTKHSKKPIVDLDDEDAICRRTRARYSLASFTLDELEAFLQETDDDDDLQNVDDEEEYRKFLAAVLKGEDYDCQSTQENENIDDEDEDNDADFEIELEEMLESDYEEGKTDKPQKVRAGRRPETRQNRRQKASTQNKKKLLEQGKRPLRPLFPILPNGPPIIPLPTLHVAALMPETSPTSLSYATKDAPMNGFAPHQIGQLYCLIHEHVQLLVQVFSLCILDPSRQHIASQVQGLIFEMLRKRDEVTTFRSEPYPDMYFRPPYTCSSVSDEPAHFCLEKKTFESPSSCDTPGLCSLPDTQMIAFPNISEERCGHVLDGQVDCLQTFKGSFWVPSVSDPVLSVLDVAPLNLVGEFVDDVYTAVQEYRQRCVESSSDILFEREPLFPFHSFASSVEGNDEFSKGRALHSANAVSSSTSQQQPKKSLAAALVESTKKQSVALVPKEISKLAHRFFPLFNPSLFPHKPPPVAVANRVLFTDAEDDLLALGIMEYNTDWKAIQQRFLPCKSKHQIFVRQKNRCSSKAPENPIKAVRRMKTSPLTAKEIECIQEGLKVYKLDWMSVWKFVVPHRDPTLLRRQWRIALGTQKCYKQDAAKKEKRRLYELKRRNRTADLANWHLDYDKEGEIAGGENNSGDDYIENADDGYVHEAFLADWRPGVSSNGSSGHPCVTAGEGNGTGEKLNIYESTGSQTPSTNMHGFPWALHYSQLPYGLSHYPPFRHQVSSTMQPNHPTNNLASKTSKSQLCMPPVRARRSNNPHLVKLAPDLPPVNLPPSVRVISQSAFKNVQHLSSANSSTIGGGVGHAGQENAAPLIPEFIKSGTPHLVTTGRERRNSTKENITNSQLEESHVLEEERGPESDLQMHPLLFQAPENGRLPYYPLNNTAASSSSFSFFSANQPHLNLSLFHSPRQVSRAVCFNKAKKNKESTSLSCAIDFHPLLKRTENVNNGGPSSSIEKSNELDLEIHLSSSSTKERALGSRGMTAGNHVWSPTNVDESGDKMESQNTSTMYYRCDENCRKVVPNAPFSVARSSSNTEDIGDHSLPEIVMEQEELSDSDEDIEEHVEFECEEMTDSEGEEGSGCEEVADNKYVHNKLTEKAKNGDIDHQRSPSHAQASVCVSGEGSPPFLKLGLTNMGKDTSSSWLSLNSCAPGRSTRRKPNNIEGTISEGHVKNVACHPNRSFKKTTPSAKKVAAKKHSVDTAEQLSLSPLPVRTVRKHRNRAFRTNTSLNIGATTGSSTVDGKDELD